MKRYIKSADLVYNMIPEGEKDKYGRYYRDLPTLYAYEGRLSKDQLMQLKESNSRIDKNCFAKGVDSSLIEDDIIIDFIWNDAEPVQLELIADNKNVSSLVLSELWEKIKPMHDKRGEVPHLGLAMKGLEHNPNTPEDTLKEVKDYEYQQLSARIQKEMEREEKRRLAQQNKLTLMPASVRRELPEYDPEEFESFWSTYLGNLEEKVNDELGVEIEISAIGGDGSTFIHFANSDHDSIEVSFREWSEQEREMALESKTKSDYISKYRNYVKSIINL